ncbi:hypothetical protein HAX54_019841 [Datura stramonium]|uniref:Transmembrane protein n=1 Tax=Datura stramonium TaxID=4076 RepID=A0ABS8USF0_DATST|nr:hypothetical protein [Datura stramonium]
MAFSPKSQLLFFSLLCIFFTLSHSFNPSHPNKVDVHDLLPAYNLPKGLLPDNVKSYTISPKDSSFTVQLTHPCYVQFEDQLVYYRNRHQGN